MALIYHRFVLLIVLGLAVLVKSGTDDSSDVEEDVNRVYNMATSIPEQVDKRNTLITNSDSTEADPTKQNPPEESTEFIETTIRGLGDAIQTYMSKRLGGPRKRAINNKTIPWDYNIPIIFDASYGNPFYRNLVVRVMKYISSKSCLSLKDETSRWDSSNEHWFTQNGYHCDCYIKMITGDGCDTRGSGPKNGSFVQVKPCADSDIILHETFHALGVPHEQEAYNSSKYISVFYKSIRPELRYTYTTSENMQTSNFDSTTTMLYVSGTWSSMGDDTFDFIRPDQGRPDETTSSERVVFSQLNSRYQCAEKFCSNKRLDCGPGYLTRINNVCKCVCPPEYDSSTNCKEFINKGDQSLKWEIPISFFAGGTTFSCPPGFQVAGWFSHCGTWTNKQSPTPAAKYPSEGKTTYYPVCSKTGPTTNVDWNWIPLGGRYCFIKPLGVDCGGVLTEATVQIQSLCEPQFNGSVGDITFDSASRNITMKVCCSNYDDTKMETILPNVTPFRLFTIYGCPNVEGMRTYRHSLSFYTKVAGTYTTETKPLIYHYSQEYVVNMCYFQPPVYGCSQNVKLTSSRRTVTITTPGYPGPRPADTRCFYCFDAPVGTQLRVTFIDYDLETEDKMRIKMYHQWAAPYRLVNDNPWKQFVTESNYLCMEFWSGYATDVTNKGAKFTVDLLDDSDSCYDRAQNGMDYVGTTSVSETYEPCMPWKDTVTCDDSPVNAQEALTGYFESNYCRNPGGKLLQPWCYVYRNDTSCIKRYCDVCNTKDPVDTLKTSDCADYMSREPKFCQKSFQRFLCFKSCGMKQAPSGSSGTCSSSLPVPTDGSLVERSKRSYKAGERAYVQCKKNPLSDNSTTFLLCTKKGWIQPRSACLDLAVATDKYSSCQQYLNENPYFCKDEKTIAEAKSSCGRSCGLDPASPMCSEPSSSTYTRVSGTGPVTTGDYMTFECKAGYFLTGGDTSRACGLSGSLLGKAPVCDKNPSFLDVGLGLVRRRQSTLSSKLAFVMDEDGYRVPFSGKITTWYYYCSNPGLIYLLVFRKSGSDYNIIGYNTVNCIDGWRLSFSVPPANQTSVVAGDMVGAWTTISYTMSVTKCESAQVKILDIPTAKSGNEKALLATTSYTTKTCIIPALAFRVEK